MEAHGSFQFQKEMARQKYTNVKKGKMSIKRKVPKSTKAYVKRAISKTQEKKEFVHQDLGKNFSVASITSYNLNYHGVGRGTGEIQFVGNGYKIKQIQANFQLTNYAPALLAAVGVPIQWMVAIIRTKVYKTTTSLTTAELFDENVGLLNTQASFFRDSDKMKVLAQKNITIRPDPSSTRNSVMNKVVKLSCRPNLNFKYRDFDTSYEGQYYNYYAIALPCDYPSVSGATGYRGDIYTRVTFADS